MEPDERREPPLNPLYGLATLTADLITLGYLALLLFPPKPHGSTVGIGFCCAGVLLVVAIPLNITCWLAAHPTRTRPRRVALSGWWMSFAFLLLPLVFATIGALEEFL